MNYELSKQLKEAGFPNSGDWKEEILFGGDKIFRIDGYNAPNLKELIEACGEEFYRLDRQKMIMSSDKYWAYNSKRDDAHSNRVGCSGKTPSEAVARLWLKLNRD